jgi:transcriptional regulator
MYVPAAFQVDDPERIAEFIAGHSFATVITQHEGSPFASHVPLLYERDRGEQGVLIGHLARPNPQWQPAVDQPDGIAALAILHGPHTYISPTWYGEPNTVPTWNYIAVHATGKLKLIDDHDRLLQLLKRSVDIYEANQPQPWKIEDQDPAFIQKLVGGIVGFEIAIEKLEGKWKLNQNQSPTRRERVIAVLQQSNRQSDIDIGKCMQRE